MNFETQLVHAKRMYPEIDRIDGYVLERTGFPDLESYLAAGLSPPPGTDLRSVGTDMNDSDWAAWEAQLTADDTEDQTGEQRTSEDLGELDIDTSNDGGYTIKATVQGGNGYRFNEQGNWPSCAGVEGSGARITSSTTHSVLVRGVKKVVIEWLQITTSSGNGLYVNLDCTGFVGRFLMIYNCGENVLITNSGGTDSTATLHHVGAYSALYRAFRLRYANLTVYLYHCTCINSGYGGFDSQNDATVYTYNCISLDNTFDDFDVEGGDYNIDSDGTDAGANSWNNETGSDILVDLTAASEDLHMKAANDGSFEGTDETATVGTLDIDGDTISDFDVGWDEIAAATVVGYSFGLILM